MYRPVAEIAWSVVAADLDPRLNLTRMVVCLGERDWMQTRRALELVLDSVHDDPHAAKHFRALDRAWHRLSQWNIAPDFAFREENK